MNNIEMFVVVYLIAVYMFVFRDAMMSIIGRKRYHFWRSLGSSLFFPVCATMVIYLAIIATRQFEDPQEMVDELMKGMISE